jgi:catechol 2,3-dioxygenase-like lactoylglutathione lyase family enzyme
MTCIAHIAIKVDDLERATKFYEGALKCRAPDGTVAEIVAAGRYKKQPEPPGA